MEGKKKLLSLDLAFFIPFFSYFIFLILILHGFVYNNLGRWQSCYTAKLLPLYSINLSFILGWESPIIIYLMMVGLNM